MPSAWYAALCMVGEREWATGSPMTASTRVLALISTLALGGQAVGDRGREGLELLAGVAIDDQIAAERIADFVAALARVLAKDPDLALAAKLVYARAVMAGHGEDQIGVLNQLARQEPRAVTGEIESAFQADQVGAFG